MISVLAMPQAGHLSPERRAWLAEKSGEYREYLIYRQGEEPETARRRAFTRATNNCTEK